MSTTEITKELRRIQSEIEGDNYTRDNIGTLIRRINGQEYCAMCRGWVAVETMPEGDICNKHGGKK